MSFLHRIVLAGGIALFAIVPETRADSSILNTPLDAELNRLAYSALMHDEVLADLNIGVRAYRGGTVILWGSALPSDVARAEELLKKLPGVITIRNTCEMAGATDPIVRRVEIAMQSAPPSPPAENVIVPPLVSKGLPLSRRPTTAEKPKLKPVSHHEPATRLLAPIPSLDYTAVERLRRSDSRYARLTFDLRDERIVIGGSAQSPSVAWELARKVSAIVGDRAIVVGKIGR